jgi:hypothetical protein
MEETSITHEEFQSSTNTSIGGKGVANIAAAQWGDKWTSTTHQEINLWEEFTSVNWEDALIYPTKSGRLALSTSPAQLTSDNTNCAFLYINNLSENNVLVSLNGTSGNYYIIVSEDASVCLKGSDDLQCNEVYVKSASGTAEIEYLIAKE